MHTSLSKKLLAGLLSLVMVLSLVAPSTSAQAATKYSLTDKTSVKSGVTFKYELKGVSKGCYVKVTRNVSGEKVVYNKQALTKTTKINGTGKTMNLYVTYGEKEENYTGKFTVRVYGKKTNKLYKTLVEEVTVKVPVQEEVLAIDSVVASNATTLKITGTLLNTLSLADVTSTELTFTGYEASEDGKSATVTVSGGLTDGKEYKVTVSGKEFTVKYTTPEITSVSIDNQEVDWNTADQVVAIKVNGSTTTVDELIKQGYTVEFTATDYDVNGTQKIFGATGTSTTGKVYYDTTGTNKLTVGDVFKVTVSLTKDGKVLTSNAAKVTVVNKNQGTHAILGVYMTNDQNTDYSLGQSGVLIFDPAGSKTETDTLVGLDIMINNKEKELASADIGTAITSGLLKIESSNEAVASVDVSTPTTPKVKAESVGSAVITITYGTAKETINYTVKNYNTSAREPKKVISGLTYTTSCQYNYATPAGLTSISYIILDQYNDVMKTVSDVAVTADVSNLTLGAVTDPTTGYDGTVATTVAGTFNGIVQFKVNGVNIGYLSLSLTKNNVSAWKVVQKAPSAYSNAANGEGYYEISSDATLDMYRDKSALYAIEAVDAKGNVVMDATAADTDDFTITSASTCATVNATSGDKYFTVTGAKVSSGSVSIKVKETASEWSQTMNVSVTDTTPYITGVSFKSVADITAVGVGFSLTDVLNLQSNDVNPVISVTTSVALTGKIRLADDGKIYLDSDADGKYTAGSDLLLGTIKAVATSNSKSTISGAATTLSANVLTASYITASKDAGTLNIIVSSGNASYNTTVKFDVD